MIVKKGVNHTLIKPKAKDFDTFLAEFDALFKGLNQANLILDLSKITNNSAKNINQLLPLIKQSKLLKKSFIVVAQAIDIESVSNQITCTPTLLEAEDILEMEMIERDLGF